MKSPRYEDIAQGNNAQQFPLDNGGTIDANKGLYYAF